ncbi:hypothetical protein A2761_00890 [Candidatus Kaiserbacteria bacterium RIFCSPHIGHO2_01_FULL_51_33]|uniref:Cell division protein FtsX n=1 Tax=Candidatus Kaiserbacteria bacterium RIFCSPLOWO2_01_FULL_51_21 TaxID=1798508 RepID=A0A1F6ECY4_9BACT|nr:MAG: hypothetical protein A2761_00890 [Candidatus Kaiserbacteria bacterium RIFCSPHIGHO2_01_FULL_51_33]OGG71470.1 MAG: hypothetical protein A3A35_03455 [Candidatus Kaiserbacteria bacterium RIFCSPLOWO2_01_FULL_51_21]
MDWVSIERILRSGFVSFWRNWFVSLTSLLMMTVTLSVIGSLFFLGAVLTTTLGFIKDKVDVSVYFHPTASETDILSFKRSLETLPEVSSVEYTSREQALVDFRKRHENDQLTLQALDELGENPLEASLGIKAKDPSQYEIIARSLQSDTALGKSSAGIVDRVNYVQNKTAIDNLTKIISSARTFGYAVIAILMVASILITFTTIRLAIYVSRDEISVMKLVGASNTHIRGPFIFVGLMYGVIAGFFTLLLFFPLTLWLGPVTERFFSGINLYDYYLGNFGQLFLIIVGAGIFLGVTASFWAVKRYLQV